MAELSEVKKMLLKLSDREILALIGTQQNRKSVQHAASGIEKTGRWFDAPITGLSDEGRALLKDLEAQNSSRFSSNHTEKKQIRYLRTLKNMKLEVPKLFYNSVNPKELYTRLKSFCISRDIPDEIVSRVVPTLVAYIETGHMRPIIFVGEKGCGKTTAVRLLVEEALQIPTEVIKAPQTDGGHGMTGDCGTYYSADVGCIAKARLRENSLIVAYIIDEIDKVSHDRTRASIDDELLSLTDESNAEVYDNYLETTLVGLEHCPMFFTANDLQKVNPILADRCMIITFPSADAARIKSIGKKYAEQKLQSNLYSMIEFNYDLMLQSIDHLVDRNVTSLRKHQQMIEAVLENALNEAFVKEGDSPVPVTEDMFIRAETEILGGVDRRAGFCA